jgi:hypothetical protein
MYTVRSMIDHYKKPLILCSHLAFIVKFIYVRHMVITQPLQLMLCLFLYHIYTPALHSKCFNKDIIQLYPNF